MLIDSLKRQLKQLLDQATECILGRRPVIPFANLTASGLVGMRKSQNNFRGEEKLQEKNDYFLARQL